MKKYTELLPKLDYNGVLVTDITRRFAISDGVKEFKDEYYKTQIKQHQTPEVVSSVLYGTPDYWWVICAINDVYDPFYDWVMSDNEVYAYTEKKYDDINGIHHFQDAEYNVYENNNAESTLEPITNIEYEMYQNDLKLRINTIKPKNIKRVVKEMRDRLKLLPTQQQG
jgi:hypothetical protein